MHRISTKRLTAFIVSLVACLALVGSSALYSAQSASIKASAKAAKQEGPAATKAAASDHKAPVAKAPGFSQKKSARKRTNGASNTHVSGTVTDGSGHGWPLYAQLEFTSASTEPLDVYTDPVTGQYEGDLFTGVDYTVTVTAFSPGYTQGRLDFTTDGTPLVQDWPLTVNAASCNALGYQSSGFTAVLSESFDAGEMPAGWSVDQTSGEATWYVTEGADPCGLFEGNETGGEGPYAIINSNCFSDISNTDDSSLVTPSVDASALSNVAVQWANDYRDAFDVQGSSAAVDASTDGGTTWNNVWYWSGTDLRGPGNIIADLNAGGSKDVKVRFHFNGFWAWWWQVDNVMIGEPLCTPVAGGLVVGNVIDGNTDEGLGGATVANLTSAASTTTSGDGFYVLFSPAGPQSLLASMPGYAADGHTVTVFNNDAVRRDFVLEAAHLDASPRPVSAVIAPESTTDMTMTVSNSGEPSATFSIVELNAPLAQNLTAGFASKAQRQQALSRLPMEGKQRNDRATSAAGLAPLMNPHATPVRPHIAAGATVIASYPTDITFGWGVATNAGNVWLSNIGVGGGDDLDYEYNGGGSLTGNTIDDSGWIGAWAADGANNPLTGMMWRVNVGGDNCLYELNPATHTATGNSICGDFAVTSQRGMAYDAVGDTYFVGGWNEGVVYHVDAEGNSIDSAFVALPISGMAYNANNGHLLVMSNTDGDDITVLDAFNNYAVLDSFKVLDNGTPIFGAFEQAGMEFDCLGNLWMVNQISQVLYKVASDDGSLCEVDIPWLTVDPVEGKVAGNGGTSPVTLTYNSAGLLPGLNQAQLQISSDTPYTVPGVPVTLTVLFNDVPEDSFAWNFIYGAAGAGIMRGCSYYSFCPNGNVTRADMAGYLERAIHGPLTPPPVYLGQFLDVFFNDYNANYIQGLIEDGITAGCSASPSLYCPNVPVTRAQMSVFVWKSQHGSTPPPACTGVFLDVPCPDGFAVDYIEGLYNEGVTAGCGGGNFCPHGPITAAQMAVFLVKGFNIPYLP